MTLLVGAEIAEEIIIATKLEAKSKQGYTNHTGTQLM
jgi:hypothetical protein